MEKRIPAPDPKDAEAKKRSVAFLILSTPHTWSEKDKITALQTTLATDEESAKKMISDFDNLQSKPDGISSTFSSFEQLNDQ